MKIASTIIIILAIVSCSINRNSKRSDFLKYEDNGWSFYFNSQKVTMCDTYLDNSNFSSFQIDKAEKKVFIAQKKFDTNLLTINQLISSDSKFSKIDFVVIDGTPYEIEKFEEVKIEQSAIKELFIMKDTANLFHRTKRNILIIKIN